MILQKIRKVINLSEKRTQRRKKSERKNKKQVKNNNEKQTQTTHTYHTPSIEKIVFWGRNRNDLYSLKY